MSQPPDDDLGRLPAASEDPAGVLDRLAQEFVERARRGEGPSIETYARAYPDLAADIRGLFPVLAVVEGLKAPSPGAVSRGGGAPRTGTERPPGIPELIDDYRIMREIGRGGMGSVHEGLRVGPDGAEERVAIKIIHPHLLQEMEYVARFLREADAGQRVDHPNVVRTLSTGLLDVEGHEVPYLVLEYVEGQNLRALLREVEVVPERLCRHIGARMADALAATHAAGLVHRDVKPENVVITADEQVKLADLGVAVLQDRAARLSRTGDFVGSLLYAAPEQLAGDAPAPSWDLYSLGIVLFELATGHHPGREKAAAWLRPGGAVRSATSLRALDPRISPFFDALVSRLLDVDPDRRFASAGAVRDALSAGENSAWWRAVPHHVPTAESRLGAIDRPTAFHGRQAEWATLDRQWAAATQGEGRAVLIVGEAGMGKTRLVQEWLAAQPAAEALRVLVIRHGPGGGEAPGEELFAAIRALVGEDGLEARLRELLGTLAPLAPVLARYLEGEVVPQSSPVAFEAATTRLLGALATERPIVLILEDLHFGGAEGQQRYLRLARALQSRAVLLIGTTRPVPPPNWAVELDASSSFLRLDLAGLDEKACRELILDASSSVTMVDESIRRLTRRADSNPLFLLELVREARGRKRGDPGTRGTDTKVPRTIQSVIASRLAALDPADRELLEAAACCGDEFDPVIAAEAAGVPRIDALKRFGRLDREQHLLRPAQRHYRFRHHLVQETLHADLHPALRETYHAALGRALAARSATREVGPRAVALCRHFLHGGEPERARPHLRSALEHAAWEVYGHEAKEWLIERALETPGLLEGADRAFALMARGTALESEARHDEARAMLVEALQVVPPDDRSGIEEDALRALARVQRNLALYDEMEATYLRAEDRARAHGDGPRVAMAMCGLGHALMTRGRLDEAEAFIQRGFDAIVDQPNAHQEGRLTTYRAQLAMARGHNEAAVPLLECAHKICHGIGDLPNEMMVLYNLANIESDRGRMERALGFLQRALEVERQLGYPHLLVNTMCNLGHCLRELGRLDEALDCVTQAHGIAARRDDAGQQAASGLRLGTLLLDHGRLAEAEVSIARGWERALALDAPLYLAPGAMAQVDLFGLEGREEEALAVLSHLRAAKLPRWPPRMELRLRASEGLLHERMGRWAEALRIYEEARERAPSVSSGLHTLYLSLARALVHCGRSEGIEERLRETLSWARAGGMLRMAVLAEVHLAGLPGGDLLAACVTLERNEASLPVVERIEAHHALWQAGAGVEHLRAADRYLRDLQAGAPPEYREALVSRVALHKQIRAAADEGARG